MEEVFNVPTENDNFYFDLGEKVRVQFDTFSAVGIVEGRAEYLEEANEYLVRFEDSNLDDFYPEEYLLEVE